ncbi:pyruvate phosphate dikinase, pep/pyruvate binding domain-containing protein [Toxoplasma gondii GT1]|uniref:Pyruvate phosphate dikinase, pep/pyruvate binding domain-containing protein n=14 Tax=Toxoplasma gondii TaxID=5811 RepID=S7W4G5_TOXGG|nr:pyruvate phosphate dikinase, pep/pyruvate binding domain-containing protein [Toxoplasma gondii GT1]KAF4644537.1 pyruvate phosphate dikinase, pep/pyruvate binding domain-containing protein [Toxoplasma gondii]
MHLAGDVGVQFECVCSQTHPGQTLWVVGSVPALGSWSLHAALQLETGPDTFPRWKSRDGVRVPRNQDVEFKFVIMSQNRDYVVWEQIYNRKICTDSPIIYKSRFGEWQSETTPWVLASKAGTVGLKLSPIAGDQQQQPTWMGRSPDTAASPVLRLSSHLDLLSSPSVSPSTSSLGGISPFSVGRRVPENAEGEARERSEEGPESATLPSSALQRLVEGEQTARSWREKLEVVKNVLAAALKEGKSRCNPQETVTLIDSLAYCSIYLHFVSQGDIVCTEDGRHFRPNHHASLSRELCIILEQIVQEMSGRDDIMADATRILARSIAPSLPSFGAPFTASQPLTRIRDIAHRNDIPSDLKNEIKHTLQNKLHRCAGPEDLVTAENLLRRFHTNPSAYPHAFVVEFERFYDELRRFFNATDLETRLVDLRQQENPRAVELINRFLESKSRSDDPNAGLTKLLVTLSVCADLRAAFTCQLRDSCAVTFHQDIHQVQEMRLAEILLDDVAFVLLSRSEALFEQEPNSKWAEALEALSLGVQNVRISGIKRDECRALANEFSGLARQAFHSRDDYLILKASLDRCRRLCEDFTDLQIALFSTRALALGAQLKLPEHAVRVFSEAVVRSSVVFQISKLCRALLRGIQVRLNLQPYDTLVAGKAVGSLLFFDTLEEAVLHCIRRSHSASSLRASGLPLGAACSSPESEKNSQQLEPSTPNVKLTLLGEEKKTVTEKAKEVFADSPPIILAARCASGDEEIAGLDGPNARVVAIVVGHDLPILSHLGVRARQKGVPFVACQDPGAFEAITASQGKIVSLSADAQSVSFQVLEGGTATEALQRQRQQEETLDEKGTPNEENPPLLISSPSLSYPFSSAISSSLLASPSPPATLTAREMTLETCGAKAATCARLRILAEEAESKNENGRGCHAPMNVFEAANCLAFPYGTAEWLIQQQGERELFQSLIEKLETSAPGSELDEAVAKLQDLIMHLNLPEEIVLPVVHLFGTRSRLVVRSSANVEDLKGMSAAGLYESVANVSVMDAVAFRSAVVTVWASLYSRRAVLARRAAGVPQHQACMAVLIQELVSPELSFILHTVNPLEKDKHRLYAEICPGLGETLASAGTRGSPYRMLVNKATGEMTMLSFCNYSTSLVPAMPKNRSFIALREGKTTQQATPQLTPSSLVKSRVMDYTIEPMTHDLGYRVHIAHRLAGVAVALEAELEGPQDVEGVISGDAVWVVQSRPQPVSD